MFKKSDGKDTTVLKEARRKCHSVNEYVHPRESFFHSF